MERGEQALGRDHAEHLLGVLTQRHLPAALQHIQRSPCGRARECGRFVFQVWHGHTAGVIVSLTT